MNLLKKIFIFLSCVLILEVKNLKIIVDQIFFYFIRFNLFKLIIYKLGFKNIIPLNIKSFKNFINEKKIPLINKNLKEKDEIILVENFINLPTYTYLNLVCGLFLKKLYNFKIYGLLRRGDIKAEILFKKFNIDNIIYIDEPNFFNRIKYIIKAINFSDYPISIKKFCKLKYKGATVGLTTYDSYIRYKKIPTTKNTNIQILCMLAQSMCKCDQMISRVFSNKKIKKIVQSELAFTPMQSLFQLSLLNNVEVYSRCGESKNVSIRKYDNVSQKYQYKLNISNEIFNRVYRTKKKQTLFLFKQKIASNLNNKFGHGGARMPNSIVKKKLIKKNEIYDYFQLKKKPIVCFFLNHLIDVNYHYGPRVNFQDNLGWINFVLNEIKKNKKVNWLIKPHPLEKHYGTTVNLISKIKELEKKYDHIKLYPDELSSLTLVNSIDLALTSHGSVGFEYPAFGVRSMFVNKSTYSNINFCKMVDNKKKIYEKFKKIHSTKKMTKIEIEKYRILIVLKNLFIYNKCTLFPVESINRNINEEKYWQNCHNLMKKFNFKDDVFYQMLKQQIKFKTRHTYNYNLINLSKIKMNDFNN